MYLDLGLSGVFRDQTRLMGLGEENTEVECPSRHSPLGILDPPPTGCHPEDDLDLQAQVVFWELETHCLTHLLI